MSAVIDSLLQFNSKERFFLVGQILGNPKFVPSADFREQLYSALGLKLPEEVFSAMDYHIDWLYAALQVAKSGETFHNNEDKRIKAQQEDIDFVIACDVDNVCHIILIEAKGVTGWTNKQMNSKVARLRDIFGPDGRNWAGVEPHFVLMSPRKPGKLEINSWPGWMKIGDNELAWIALNIPEKLLSITRCDVNRRRSEHGEYWTVRNR